MPFIEQVNAYIRAAYAALYVVTSEELRAEAAIHQAANCDKPRQVWRWSQSEGWISPEGKLIQTTDPMQALAQIPTLPEASVLILRDFHPYLGSPPVMRKVRDLCYLCRATERVLVFESPLLKLPVDLEKEITVVPFGLPDRSALAQILTAIVEGQATPPKVSAPVLTLVEAALGMTATEAENAFALALVRHGSLGEAAVQTILDEKAQVVQKGDYLEYLHPEESLAKVGGLASLKGWLAVRRTAFSAEARTFGLPAPRGVLLVGVAGCGKSATVKAIAAEWRLPLLRLDMGRMFGSLVGQSEENIRRALAMAESMAPCILWIDEIEKGAAGAKGSGSTDNGTTSRVVSTVLTWMQEKRAAVFVAATANEVAALPGPLLRKGRFDELFFVDLPTPTEREEILAIHLAKRQRDPKRFDLTALAASLDSFGGAEIEEAVVEGMFLAFHAKRDLDTSDILEAARKTVPLSVTSKEEVDAIRDWAKGHARPAGGAAVPAPKGRLVNVTPRKMKV
jgi:ATP-dependent 26S proteasome regulatory subunit